MRFPVAIAIGVVGGELQIPWRPVPRQSSTTSSLVAVFPNSMRAPDAPLLAAGFEFLAPILFELAVQCLPVETQDLGGPALVASDLLQNVQDVAALQIPEPDSSLRRLRHQQAVSTSLPNPRRQVIGRELLVSRDASRALDRVPELAHVPGPGVHSEQSHGRSEE